MTGGFSESAVAYFRAHAIDPAVAEAVGVRAEPAALIFPGGRVRSLNGAQPRLGQPRGQELSTWWPHGRPSDASLVLATEGESDCLAALTWLPETPTSAGLRELPVLAIPGTGFPVARLVDELRKAGAHEVVLGFDADEPGRAYVDRAAAALREQGIRPVPLDLREGLDLAAWLAGMEPSARGECFASALIDAEAAAPLLGAATRDVRIVTLDDFADVDEAGAAPLLGRSDEVLIPENADAMIYGDGGASKTTLSIDLAFHLAAGDDWVGIPVPKPVRVLVIEAEGPRPLFRRKLRAKRDAWRGSPLGDRLLVMETPWAQFHFPDAEEVAELIGKRGVDAMIVGPLTRVGMDELGTLQQVRDFQAEVNKFRARSGRRLTVFLIHHENKGGKVSGAWEGAGDTLLHAEVRIRGKTRLTIQKARWSSEWHKQKLELAWTQDEGFERAEEPHRDLVAEIFNWLRANPYSTAQEIATEKKVKRADRTTESTIPGIGARETAVRDELEANRHLFRCRVKEDAKAVGRHPSAHVWEVLEGPPETPADPGAPSSLGVGTEAGQQVRPPVRGGPVAGGPTLIRDGCAQDRDRPSSETDRSRS